MDGFWKITIWIALISFVLLLGIIGIHEAVMRVILLVVLIIVDVTVYPSLLSWNSVKRSIRENGAHRGARRVRRSR